MNKILMLLYLLVFVDIIERNQQKQTSCKTAAANSQRWTRLYRPFPLYADITVFAEDMEI